MMFPFLTKSKNLQPHLQRFSHDEVMRVLKYDIDKLNNVKEKLDKLKKNKSETSMRKKINEREKQKLTSLITTMKNEINRSLLEILDNTEPIKHGVILMKNRSLFELQRQCDL